jgi:cellulose synthase/poly-beta-1,6-N-acetylglucosamine synthase-like glycosyltransferase
LPEFLDFVCGQDYEDYEIIVVDDHSEDGSFGYLRGYNCKKLKVLELAEQKSGKKEALRHGFLHSNGEYLVFTDADAKGGRHWLSSIVECGEGADLIFGDVFLTGKSFLEGLGSLEYAALMAGAIGGVEMGMAYMMSGANYGLWRRVYANADIREDLVSGDDVFLLEDVLRRGGKVNFCLEEGAGVKVKALGNFKQIFVQHVRWASKSGYYTNNVSKLVAIAVLLGNLGFILAIFCMFWWAAVIKILTDILLVLPYLVYYRRLFLIRYAIILGILYPFFVLAVAIFSQFYSFEWKGRKYGIHGRYRTHKYE